MAIVHSGNLMVAALNFLPTVSEEDVDSSSSDGKRDVRVRLVDRADLTMNGREALVTNGKEALATTNGEEAPATNGNEAQATNGEEAPATNGNEAQAANGREAQAVNGKEAQVKRQTQKLSIAQTVLLQMKKNGMQPVEKRAEDFYFLRPLGEGAFSTVFLVREVRSGKEYAVKVLTKSLIYRLDKVTSVMREKDVMTSLTYIHGSHELFVSLYCTFQDASRLYIAMTYAENGDLMQYLQRLGSFDEEVTLFYTAEIVIALDFLHRCGIIHRDVKPENVLLRKNWHIMLSDFGSAKFTDPEKNEPEVKCTVQSDQQRSRSTFVGTAQYVSPEVLVDGEIGPSCDYWALGAMIFQMVSGMAPFRSINDYHTFQKIQRLEYTFPEGFPDLPRDLVEKFLVLEPVNRLGSEEMGGSAAVRSHPYFATIDWNNLTKKTPPAFKPYVPASSGEPAFHSNYHIPENIEPGLDDAAVTRLMGLSLRDFVPTDVPETVKEESQPTETREQKLITQRREHKYHRFVEENLIIKSGFLEKKKGLFSRRRMFLLTEGPNIYYVDPLSMELKGKIPFSRQLRVEAKNFRTFFVHTPSRTYYLFDPERNAVEWCNAIEAVREQYLHFLPDEPMAP